MSILFSSDGKGLTRSGAYFNPAASWSWLFWANGPAPPVLRYETIYMYGDSSFLSPYIWVGYTPSGIQADINGSVIGPVLTTDFEVWKSIALTYNSATTTLSLLINGVSVGTTILNLAGVTFTVKDEYLFTDTGAFDVIGGLEIFNVMTFSTLLTASQVTAQVFSSSILAGTILTNTPLANATDIDDNSGNGRNWSNISTAGTSKTSPTLIPTATANIAATSAYQLGSSFPKTFIQNCHPSGTTLTKWYKLTPGLNQVSSYGLGDTTPGYAQSIAVYEGPASAPTPLLGGIVGLNVPTQWPSAASTEYFLKSLAIDATDNPAFLVLDVEVHEEATVVAGDILVNDDSSGFPCAIISGTEDYVIKKFIQPFAAGEEGDVLQNGNMILEDADNNQISGYKSNFDLIRNIADPVGVSSVGAIRSNRGNNKFYIVYENGVNPATVYTIDAGVAALSSKIATLTGTTAMGGMAASNDGKTLYFCRATANQPIRTWNLETDAAGANFLAAVPSYQTRAILVMPDDSLFITYYQGGVKTYVEHRDSDGSLLHTYDYGATNSENPRLSFEIDNDHFRIWLQPDAVDTVGIMQFLKTNIATGVSTTRLGENFENGVYQGSVVSPPRSRFGLSFSCPMFVLLSAPVAKSGLYILTGTGGDSGGSSNPILRHDVDWTDVQAGESEIVKIPDPYYDTYLAGDE